VELYLHSPNKPQWRGAHLQAQGQLYTKSLANVKVKLFVPLPWRSSVTPLELDITS